MNAKRILSLILAVIMLCSMFLVACDKGDGDKGGSNLGQIATQEQEDESKVYDAEIKNLNGHEFRFVVRNASGANLTTHEVYAEAPNGDKVNDAVFARNWPYQWGSIASDGTISQENVTVAPLPEGGSVGGWLLGMNAKSQNKEGAFALIEFISSAEGQKIMSMQGGYLPGFNQVLEDPEVIDANKLLTMPGFQKALGETVARPVAKDYNKVSDEIQQAVQKYLSTEDADIEEAAAAIEAALAEAEPLQARWEKTEEN